MKTTLLLVAATLASFSFGQVTYRVTDLGVLPAFTKTEPLALNDLGQVVGYCHTNAPEQRAFLWHPGTGLVNLGTLPGRTTSRAYGVNNLGQVVGTTGEPDGFAFVWSSTGGMQSLPPLPGDVWSHAYGINDAGQVIGNSHYISGYTAAMWSVGGVQNLGDIVDHEFSNALAVNSLGQVAGACTFNDFNIHGPRAFRWTDDLNMHVLGTPQNEDFSVATGINDEGAIVGYHAFGLGRPRAFIWTSLTGRQDLTPPATVATHATGVNNSAHAVGYGEFSFEVFAGVLWNGDGQFQLTTLIDPSTPGWTIKRANDINNVGQIVAVGRHPSFGTVDRGVLLTPVEASVAPTSYEIVYGNLLGGNLQALATSDDVRMWLGTSTDGSRDSPNVQVVMKSTSPVSRPIQLKFVLEAQTNLLPLGGVNQKVEFFNFSSGAWVEVDSRLGTTADSVAIVAANSNPIPFVEPGTKQVKVRLTWTGTTQFSRTSGTKIDQAIWRIY